MEHGRFVAPLPKVSIAKSSRPILRCIPVVRPCRRGEMADAIDSKSVARKGVGVRVPPPAPLYKTARNRGFFVSRPRLGPKPTTQATTCPLISADNCRHPMRPIDRGTGRAAPSTDGARDEPAPGILGRFGSLLILRLLVDLLLARLFMVPRVGFPGRRCRLGSATGRTAIGRILPTLRAGVTNDLALVHALPGDFDRPTAHGATMSGSWGEELATPVLFHADHRDVFAHRTGHRDGITPLEVESLFRPVQVHELFGPLQGLARRDAMISPCRL